MNLETYTDTIILGTSSINLYDDYTKLTLESGKEVTFVGDVLIYEGFVDTSFAHSFGHETQGHYEVERAVAYIMEIMDADGEEVILPASEFQKVKKEIEQHFESLEIERD